jgi:hypothetical protein
VPELTSFQAKRSKNPSLADALVVAVAKAKARTAVSVDDILSLQCMIVSRYILVVVVVRFGRTSGATNLASSVELANGKAEFVTY